MKTILASLIILAIRIMEARPKPKLIYSNVSYKDDRPRSYAYSRRHENWNDHLRDTGL